MKPTDSNDHNDYKKNNTQNAAPDNEAISRLSRVVDMSAITGARNHNKNTILNKNKYYKNSRKKNQKTNNSNTPPKNAKSKDNHKNEKTRELVRPDKVRELSKIAPMVEPINPQPGCLKIATQTYAPRRLFAIVPEITETRSGYDAKATHLIAPTPDAQSPQEKQNASVPTPDAPAAPQTIMPAPEQPHETKVRTAVRLSYRNNSKKDRSGLRSPKSRKLTARKIHAGTEKIKKDQATEENIEKIEDALLLQSWRARKWSESITSISTTFQNKIPDAMPLVQAGLVNNICVTPGLIEATIFDQVVSISLKQFTPGQWDKVIHELANRAIFATSLLNGELPEGILDIFKQAASLSLFPSKIREFNFLCDCHPEIAPCEHASALLIAFAQLLEEDPFHILTLRGMTRDNLLEQLRDARSDQVVDEKTRYRVTYELPAQNVNFTEFYSPHDDFDNLNFHIIYTPGSLIRRLGNPEPWQAPISVESILHPIIDTASREAERLGQSEQFVLPPDPPGKECCDRKNEDPRTQCDIFANIRSVNRDNCNTRNKTDIDKKFSHPARNDNQTLLSRAPKNSTIYAGDIPNMTFIEEIISPELSREIDGGPVSAAEDIYRWLLTRGASDIRTLARRTRLHKSTIEIFLNAFCDAGLAHVEGDGDRLRFAVSLP